MIVRRLPRFCVFWKAVLKECTSSKSDVYEIQHLVNLQTHPDLMKRLFMELQDRLMRNETSTPIPLLQILCLLLPMIPLSYVLFLTLDKE